MKWPASCAGRSTVISVACGVYDMVINCVEKPLLESVLHRVQGNQTHAAQMLGINRNTLRKKMKAHGIKF